MVYPSLVASLISSYPVTHIASGDEHTVFLLKVCNSAFHNIIYLTLLYPGRFIIQLWVKRIWTAGAWPHGIYLSSAGNFNGFTDDCGNPGRLWKVNFKEHVICRLAKKVSFGKKCDFFRKRRDYVWAEQSKRASTGTETRKTLVKRNTILEMTIFSLFSDTTRYCCQSTLVYLFRLAVLTTVSWG